MKNVRSILEYSGNWVAGNGNVSGTGIYLTTRKSTALSYAGAGGGLIHVQVDVPNSKVSTYKQVISSSGFKQWSRQRSMNNRGDQISKYAIQQLDLAVLDVGGGVYVFLVDPNLKKKRLTLEGLSVLGAYDRNGRKIG